MKFRTVLITAAAFCLTSTAQAVTFLTNVQAVGMYGDGSIFIFVTSNISEPGCTATNRIDVPFSHPQRKEILAIAMAARVSGQRIEGAVNGCELGSPTLDGSKNSYIYLID